MSRQLRPLLLSLLLLCTAACGAGPTPDPHEGMVQVSDGAGGLIWIRPVEGLPVNELDPASFSALPDGRISYAGDDALALHGIDVSEHQGEIDWKAVAASGVDFAILRAGYRGWSEGALREDPFFRQNLQGARDAGLRIGCYFFSQALNPDEAREEAQFLLSLLDGIPLELPVFFDWEETGADTRTAGASPSAVTDACLAFCESVREGGYEPGLYLYRRLGYQFYELDRLQGIPLWVGALGDAPDFYYEHRFWQYSITGQVPGIAADVDLDLWFIPAPEPIPPSTAPSA